MQKVKIILFIIVLTTGCSVVRTERTAKLKSSADVSNEMSLSAIQNQNVSKNSYFIQRADVQVIGQGGSEKLLASIKFKAPDQYLISLRNKTGIEAVRLFISPDTILLNDRINRKQYCVSPDYLKTKYGLTFLVIPVILGDFIGIALSNFSSADCIENKINIDCSISGLKINYSIDCRIGKSVLSILDSSLSSERIEVRNSEFFEIEKRSIPGNIEINDLKRETVINIRIKNISFSWDGIIEFVPGNKYKIIKLL